MLSKYMLIGTLFASILLMVFILSGQDRMLTAGDSIKKLKPAIPIDQQASQKEIMLLMKRFSKRSKIDLVRAVKERSITLDKKEYLLETKQQMFDKTLNKIKGIVEANNKSDDVRIEKLDGMIAEFKDTIKSFDKKLTEEESEKLGKVIKTFKEIKAKKAALIVPKMDIKLVVKVMLALPARNTAAILQNLDPALAAKISHRMAEERKKIALKNKGDQLLDDEEGEK